MEEGLAYLRKLLAFGFVATMRLLSNYFDLLFIVKVVVQYFTRFQLTARSRGPSATAGLLVFVSEVAWKKDYLRKTACIWLCGFCQITLTYCSVL